MKASFWDKVGFVLSSKQRTEVFLLAKKCKTVDEIESKVRITSFTGVKRILKDFEKEGLVRIEGNRVELTEEGRKAYERLPKSRKLFTQ
jgi:predicted transcriptional regulator